MIQLGLLLRRRHFKHSLHVQWFQLNNAVFNTNFVSLKDPLRLTTLNFFLILVVLKVLNYQLFSLAPSFRGSGFLLAHNVLGFTPQLATIPLMKFLL